MDRKIVHVAAGVVTDTAGQVLIAHRPAHVHQGGLWEFPGGKLEDDENVEQALKRELYEETGIRVEQLHPLIRIHHSYPDKDVLLDVWKVTCFTGDAHGKEGQPVKWVRPEKLNQYQFPDANKAVIKAAQLPDKYMITREYDSLAEACDHIQQKLEQGIRLLQFRAKYLTQDQYLLWAEQLIPLCRSYHAVLLLNCPVETAVRLGADGIHLSSSHLRVCAQRPLDETHWVSAAVHNQLELEQALQIDVDFVVISPVLKTKSHPEASPLGWDRFYDLTEQATCPVYALGGLSEDDMDEASRHGAQGIAAIRGLAS